MYGQAVDEILASENSAGAVLWGLADHEGTIRDIVSGATRQATYHRAYDAFGNVTEYNASGNIISESAPAADFVFGYTGKALDADTGLNYYNARWYDPAVGRFASEDPSGFAGGDMNLYRYCGNDPLNSIDPSGLCGLKSLGNDPVFRAAASQFSSSLMGGSSYQIHTSSGAFDPATTFAAYNQAMYPSLSSPSASLYATTPTFSTVSAAPTAATIGGYSGPSLNYSGLSSAGISGILNDTSSFTSSLINSYGPSLSDNYGLGVGSNSSYVQLLASTPLSTPNYVSSVPLGNTGSNLRIDESGQTWYYGEQVASVKQVGTGKVVGSALFDAYDAQTSSWNIPARVASSIASGVASAFFPPSDPSYIVTSTSGTQTYVISGGPGTGALANNALAWTGIGQGVSAMTKPRTAVPTNAAHNAAQFEQYKDALRAGMQKPHASNPQLAKYLDELYRPGAKVSSGSTAAAVREELAKGVSVGGRTHSQKAADYTRALQKWLRDNPTARPGDRAAAENVIRDMQNALNGN